MRAVTYIALYAVSSVLSYLNSVNGIWIPPFPGTFRRSSFQSEQPTDEEEFNGLPAFPFPLFLDFFHPRRLIPLKRSSDPVNEIKSEKTYNLSFPQQRERLAESNGFTVSNSSAMQHEESSNKNNVKTEMPAFSKYREGTVKSEELDVTDLHENKTANITGMITELQSTHEPHHVVKKFMEGKSKLTLVERVFDPLSRLRRFRYFYPMNHGNNRKNKTKDSGETNKTMDSLNTIGHRENLNGNETKVTLMMSQISKKKDNCSHMHFISRYMFVWRINWGSFVLQLLFILLVAGIVSFGVFMCQHFSTNEQPMHAYTVKEMKKPEKPLCV